MLAAALLLSALAQADRTADTTRFDLRCMVVTAMMRDHPDAQIRAAAASASIFFFARLDARIGERELEARLVEEAAAVDGMDRQDLARACGAFMTERGQALTAIGDRITARTQETPRPR